MAEYDEIKVGNLYKMSSDRYFVIVSLLRKRNIIAVPAYDLMSGKIIRDLANDAAITLEDQLLECEILLLGEKRVESRQTTVAQFWKAYDCVTEVPDKPYLRAEALNGI